MTARVEIYTRATCGYCTRAKALLRRKGVAFEEISLDEHPELVGDVVRRSGRTTVPQIFADGKSLGGSDDIHALDAEGALDEALGLAGEGNPNS